MAGRYYPVRMNIDQRRTIETDLEELGTGRDEFLGIIDMLDDLGGYDGVEFLRSLPVKFISKSLDRHADVGNLRVR